MTEVGLSQWTLVIFLFGLMCLFAFLLARFAFQVVLRLSKRKNRSLYRKWGVEEDLFGSHSGALFIILGIGTVVYAALTFVLALFSTLLIMDSSWVGVDQIYNAFTIFFIGFVLGAAFESQRFEDVQRKVNRLVGLRGVFHDRFRVSELLSVYESLQHLPPLFWEEYTQLPDVEVDEETNRKYRERAIPYRYSQSRRHNRIVITVATLTFLVAVLLTAREFLS